MKMEYENHGNGIMLFLEGNKEDIETKHMSLWNHGATTSELTWVTEDRAYFWTNKKDLLKALVNANLFYLLASPKTVEEYRGKKGGVWKQARELGNNEFESIEQVFQGGGRWEPRDTYRIPVSAVKNNPVETIYAQEHGIGYGVSWNQ